MARRKITGCTVRKTMCETCPFRANGDKQLAGIVLERTLLKASQICHHHALHGEEAHELCRGARNEQLTLLHRMGLIDAPTDAAFENTSRQLGVIK